jgi:hypothetical protein
LRQGVADARGKAFRRADQAHGGIVMSVDVKLRVRSGQRPANHHFRSPRVAGPESRSCSDSVGTAAGRFSALRRDVPETQ